MSRAVWPVLAVGVWALYILSAGAARADRGSGPAGEGVSGGAPAGSATTGPAPAGPASRPAAGPSLAAAEWQKVQQALALRRAGQAQRGLEILEQVARELQAHLRTHGADVRALLVLAEVQQLLGEDQRALAVLNQAVAAEPNNPDARWARAELLRGLDQPAEAWKDLQVCLRLDGRSVEYRRRGGMVLCEMGKPREGLDLLNSALGLDPNNLAVLAAVGSAQMDLGEPNRALETFRRMLRTDPNDPAAHYNIGQAQQELNQPRAALAAFRKAFELDGDDWRALAKMVEFHAQLGDRAERDKARHRLLSLRAGGTVASLAQADRYCREQFQAAGRKVRVVEHFELGHRAVKYVFHVQDPNTGKTLFRVRLSSYEMTDEIAREGGRLKPNERLFHLDGYDPNGVHVTYAILKSADPDGPAYDGIKDKVIDVVEGRNRGTSGTAPDPVGADVYIGGPPPGAAAHPVLRGPAPPDDR